ncbi:unnamed protein product, partial [Meganyctiphanes norvegica]
KAYLGLFLAIIPSLVIICLSFGIVIGFKSSIEERRTRLSYRASTKTVERSKKSRRQLVQTVTVLVVNASYGVCSVPYAILAALYETKDGQCTSNVTVELWLLVFHCLVSLWSITNVFIFIVLNKDYRDEVKCMLNCTKNNNNKLIGKGESNSAFWITITSDEIKSNV